MCFDNDVEGFSYGDAASLFVFEYIHKTWSYGCFFQTLFEDE